jgi:hypothetical protein
VTVVNLSNYPDSYLLCKVSFSGHNSVLYCGMTNCSDYCCDAQYAGLFYIPVDVRRISLNKIGWENLTYRFAKQII